MATDIPRLDLANGDTLDDIELVESEPIIRSSRPDDKLPQIEYLQKRNLCVITEFRAICNRPLEGIYVRPSDSDILEWFGVIVVKAGVFAGGIFRFTLTLAASFPDTDQIPTVEFEHNIFHPMIYTKTNRVDFRRFFPSQWVPDQNHVYHVLQALQSLFFRCDCDVEHAANPEAALLWRENRRQFKKFANLVVRESRTQIYDPPKSEDSQALRFKPWDASIMEPIRLMLLGQLEMPRDHVLSSVISREKNPYASFFNVEKASYLCDVIPEPHQAQLNEESQENGVKVNEDEEEIITSTYEEGGEESD